MSDPKEAPKKEPPELTEKELDSVAGGQLGIKGTDIQGESLDKGHKDE